MIKLGSFCVIVLVISYYGIAKAQVNDCTSDWQGIPTPEGSGAIQALHFFDRQNGVIAEGPEEDSGWARIWTTSNGGQSWIRSSAPTYRSRYYRPGISSFYFKDRLHGWAGFFIFDGWTGKIHEDLPGLWETNDGGRNWKEVDGSIHYGFMFEATEGRRIFSSGGLAALDSLRVMTSPAIGDVLRITPIKDQKFKRTIDGGKSWELLDLPFSNSQVFRVLYADTSTNRVYAAPNRQGDLDAKYKSLFVTSDFGDNWDSTTFVSNPYTPSQVEGLDSIIYVMSLDVMRSVDHGKTLTHVGGPTHGNEQLFYGDQISVPRSCNGGLLFAVGQLQDRLDYGLWVTSTGGDGTLPTECPPAFDVASLLRASSCGTSTSDVLIRNRHCDTLTLELVEIASGTDHFSVTAPKLPLTLANLETESFSVKYLPGAPSQTHKGGLHIKGYFRTSSGKRLLDTLVDLEGTTFNDSLGVEADVSTFAFGDVSNCSGCDTTITITNLSCDSARITSQMLTGSGFTYDKLALPLVLAPGESRSIEFHCAVEKAGDMKTDVRFIATLDGSAIPDTINVVLRSRASILPLALDLTQDTVDLGQISLCNTKEAFVDLLNLGCDSIAVVQEASDLAPFSVTAISNPEWLAVNGSKQIKITLTPSTVGTFTKTIRYQASRFNRKQVVDLVIKGEVVGSLPPAVSTSSIDLGKIAICSSDSSSATIRNPGCAAIIVKNVAISGSNDYTLVNAINNVRLEPDSSLTFRVKFVPQDKGARNGTITITWTNENGNNPKDITVALGANVIDGTKVLASSLNQINFGETNICEERDSLVQFTNTGCDTLTITAADIEKNFSVGDGVLPIVLPPGESVGLPITTVVDTAGKPTVLTGTLSISSTADNQIAPITLMRSLYYPTRLRIEAVDEASGKQGDVVKFRVLLEGQVPSTMTALHFDFLHNADLLSWDGYDGVGLNRTNILGSENERASFTLSPVHEGVIGEFSFKTNLALAEQTTLSFDNITFEAAGVSFAPECIAVISDTGTRFNYIYTCGDNIIRDRLAGTRLIKSITPNPASGEIRLELNAKDAQVAIIDMLGVEVLRTSTADRIDVSNLPSGTYYVRVSAAGDVETKRVVIQR